MMAITVSEELWRSSMAPLGLHERWRAPDGQTVEAGQPLAEVRIEDALHEIISPARGVFVWSAHAGDVIQPGDRIAWVEPA
jgi:biotin carboxyl carrier protein